jgi:Lon protease-like protein
MGASGSDGYGYDARPRVAEIPLFPFDVVLFPQMILPLHIFEERYKQMISRCVRESAPFGIVLATGMDEETGSVTTSSVGCTARIARVERLPDGCINIEVVGEERFRILDTHEQMPYPVGLTEPYEDEPAAPEAALPLADDVQRLLRDFLTRTLALMGQSAGGLDLPEDPALLSFTAAYVLPISNEEKQGLLSDRDASSRLATEREVLLREVTRLRRAAEAMQTVWKKVDTARFDAFRCEN